MDDALPPGIVDYLRRERVAARRKRRWKILRAYLPPFLFLAMIGGTAIHDYLYGPMITLSPAPPAWVLSPPPSWALSIEECPVFAQVDCHGWFQAGWTHDMADDWDFWSNRWEIDGRLYATRDLMGRGI